MLSCLTKGFRPKPIRRSFLRYQTHILSPFRTSPRRRSPRIYPKNLTVTGTVNINGVEMIEIVERTDKDFAVGLQYHPEAVIDKTIDCQTNASDYMSYEDALEVFTYLIDLVR